MRLRLSFLTGAGPAVTASSMIVVPPGHVHVVAAKKTVRDISRLSSTNSVATIFYMRYQINDIQPAIHGNGHLRMKMLNTRVGIPFPSTTAPVPASQRHLREKKWKDLE
jgi:hypothetical protein